MIPENVVTQLSLRFHAPVYPITSVPFVVPANGHYLVQTDLTWAGAGYAITVPSTVDNVTIEFCNATLTLTNPNSLGGILVEGVNSKTTILNAQMVGTLRPVTEINELNIGINVKDSSNVTISNSSFTDVNWCINADHSNGILIDGVYVREHNVAYNDLSPFDHYYPFTAIYATYVKNATIQNVTIDADFAFSWASTPLFVGTFEQGDSCLNVTVRNCNLFNGMLGIFDTDAVLIENITAVMNDPMFVPGILIELGGCNATPYGSINGIMRNCSLNSLASNIESFVGLNILGANGFLVDNVVINITPTASSTNGNTIALQMGLLNEITNCEFSNCIFTSPSDNPASTPVIITGAAGGPVQGITFKNCLMSNGLVNGVIIDTTNNVSIIDCNISNCGPNAIALFHENIGTSIINSQITTNPGNGIFLGVEAFASTIMGNSISYNGGDGIILRPGATANFITDNQVSNNSGNGITLNSGAPSNHFLNNKTFDNGLVGLNNVDASSNFSNEWYYNISCNNGTNVLNILAVVPQGVPVISGQNIDCAATLP